MYAKTACWLFLFFILPICVQCSGFFSLTTIGNIISGISNIFTSVNSTNTDAVIEDAVLNITELTNKYGYDLEEHTVTTEDGYILKLHRTPPRNNNTKNVVLLMHGLFDSSDCWILQGPGYALGYILADEGFDVWMGNARGNKYSIAHKTLDSKQSEYWRFSWDEIGLYDLPAMIDYVTNITGENIYYVGHSQGTTSFLVMTSLKPSYNNKIRMMFSLAPIAWVSHTRDPVIKLFTGNFIFKYILSVLNNPANTDDIITPLCQIFSSDCDNKVHLYNGNNTKFTNTSMLDIISGHLPTSSSTLQLVHYSQLVQSGRFCRFDFGEEENIQRYGEPTPPNYDISKVTVPTVLFYSNKDWLSDVVDVARLYNGLPNVLHTYLLRDFDHIDYLFASVAKDIIYAEIIKQIRLFEDNATESTEYISSD